jgi:hypothetical protein
VVARSNKCNCVGEEDLLYLKDYFGCYKLKIPLIIIDCT